jgi:CheY-like chemotaxis protein
LEKFFLNEEGRIENEELRGQWAGKRDGLAQEALGGLAEYTRHSQFSILNSPLPIVTYYPIWDIMNVPMKKRNNRKDNIIKLYEKTNRLIKGLDDVRRVLDSSDLSEKLLQAEMDAISIKKLLLTACPLPKGDSDLNKTETSEENPVIMIVDDEEMILQVTCLIISKMGLRPMAFSSSIKALEYYSKHYRKISLIILDMIMPEMNGRDLFLSLKAINPSIKGILLSGWVDTDSTDEITTLGLSGILHKPIEKAVLEESILRALES